MILVKNRLIITWLIKAIGVVLSFLYKIISFLHLEGVLLTLMIGLVFYLTGAFDSAPILFMLFIVVLIVVFVLSVFFAIAGLCKPKEKKDQPEHKESMDIMPTDQVVDGEGNVVSQAKDVPTMQTSEKPAEQPPVEQTVVFTEQKVFNDGKVNNTTEDRTIDLGESGKQTYPKYFTVKQNPKYVMAEYSDRYELFYRSESGFKRVRVDYKK